MSSTPEVSSKPPIHWPSVVQFGLSGFALLSLWGGAFTLVLAGLLQISNPRLTIVEASNSFLLAAGSGVSGLLVLPSLISSFSRLINRPIQLGKGWEVIRRYLHPGWWFLLMLPVVEIGYLVIQQGGYFLLSLPPLHAIALTLPVLTLLWLGIRKIPKGSIQRDWGALGSGMLLTPVFLVPGEIFLLFLLIIPVAISLANRPEFANQMVGLSMRLQNTTDPEKILQVLGDLINTPQLIGFVLLFMAVLVPLIEELFKPIAVWLLAGRALSPQDGMILGMISGAGFALFENLTKVAANEQWLTLVVGRVGTAAMHIFTGGLTGWALATAWRERRYLRLLIAYSISILIHAMWNGSLILISLSAALHSMPRLRLTPVLPAYYQPAGLVFILLLAFGIFAGLMVFNRRLRVEPVVELAAELESE